MKLIKRIGSMLLCLVMLLAGALVAPESETVFAVDLTTGTYNIDEDTLPVSATTIYSQMFNIKNKVEINVKMTDEELAKLEVDYEKYEKMGSKSPIYRKADMSITVTTATTKYTYVINEVGVRLKGNLSRCDFYDSSKGIYNAVHLKFDFQETFDNEKYYGSNGHDWTGDEAGRKKRKNRTFAGLEKLDSKWNRNLDATYVREYYALELFRSMGVMASKCNLASMDWSGTHMGVYMIYEPVDKAFLEKRLPEEELGGDLYKCGWDDGPPDLTSIKSIGVENEDNCEFYQYDLKTNKKTSTNESLKKLITQLNNGKPSKSTISSLVDMNYFLMYSAVSYFTGNPDDMRNNYNNYYIYFLKSTGKAVIIPYDLDRCFGVTNGLNVDGCGGAATSPFSTKATVQNKEQSNPLVKYTIVEGGYYTTSFKIRLNKVKESSLFTETKFKSIYNKAKANYETDIVPSKDFNNVKKSQCVWSLKASGGNMAFSNFYNTIKSNYSYFVDKNTVARCYIRGDFNGWNVDTKYNMTYNTSTKTYSYKLTAWNPASFKVYNEREDKWYGFDYMTSCPKKLSAYKDGDNNIHTAKGMYYIYYKPSTHKIWIKFCPQTITTKVKQVTKYVGQKSFHVDRLGAKVTKGKGTLSYSSSNTRALSFNKKTHRFVIRRAGRGYIIIRAAARGSYRTTIKKIPFVIRRKK